MSDIVLTTLNAKYIHAAFGLRYLLANLGELRRAPVCSSSTSTRGHSTSWKCCSRKIRRLSGWAFTSGTCAETTEVVAALKRMRPEVTVILGGPEVSYEIDTQEIVRARRLRHHRRGGFEVCRSLRQAARGKKPPSKNHPGRTARVLADLALPYDLYTDEDVAPPRHLRRSLARLSVHLRVLSVVARHSGAATFRCPSCCDNCRRLLDRGVTAVQVRGSDLQSERQHQPGDSGVLSRALSPGTVRLTSR